MEDDGLKTTDLGNERNDPEAGESICETSSKALLNTDPPHVNGKIIEPTAQAITSSCESRGKSAELEEEDMAEQVDQESSSSAIDTDHEKSHDEEHLEEPIDKETVNHEENCADGSKNVNVNAVPVTLCSMTEEVEKEDQNHNNKAMNTPVAVRRSSRAKQSDTPSSVGRTTRSQINPDIIAKQKSFMHKYQIAVKSSMDSYVRSATSEPDVKNDNQAGKRKWDESTGNDSPRASPVHEKKSKKTTPSTPVTFKINTSPELHDGNTIRHDAFCWTCHADGQVIECTQCPRVFHLRCIQPPPVVVEKWQCLECVAIQSADEHSPIDRDQLPVMLNFAMERIKSVADSQPFFRPVDTEEFPHYTEYVVCPVDISQLEEKIAQKAYASTRAFLADFRWILHNCIVFNSVHSKLTSIARTLMKVCKHEMVEIDTCADCYVHAHTKRETWFLEPCRRPHLLLWAKLKGFPHWPAKAMKANKEGNVDVRFFGAHDRAWVPAKDCFLYSREMPVQLKNQRKASLAASIEEVDQHIRKLVERYGPFIFPPPKTGYDPQKEDEQLQMLIPGYKIDNSRLPDPKNSDRCTDGDGESMQSDSEPIEMAENDPTAAPTVQTEDREEDRKFLAMLELAPRSVVEAVIANNSAPASRSESPSIVSVVETKSADVDPLLSNGVKNNPRSVKQTPQKVNGTNSPSEPFDRSCTSTPILSSSGTEPAYCDLPKEDSKLHSTEGMQIKSEPCFDHDEVASELIPVPNPMTISIDKVVGNYRQSPTPIKLKIVPKSGTMTKQTNSPKVPGMKLPTPKSALKSVAKVTPNRPIAPKIASATKPVPKSVPVSCRNTEGEDDDLDPAMYLDPTITITLINNEEKKQNRRENEISTSGPISSSDLQALNALGENVSITVVPKRKAVQGTPSAIRSKENELADQPMVIEVDPASLQKNRPQPGKARKTFPKSRTSLPPSQLFPQKTSQKATNPPMVSIPSRHLGADVSRTTSASSSSARIPSITVRPVSHHAPSQPSIILQPAISDATSINAVAAAAKQPANTSGGSSANSALALNSLQTVGPEAGFGTGGLLLTFNRTLPPFTAATPTAASTSANFTKSDCGPLTSQLSAKTQQIADMVRNTLETLLQEVSAAGNVEASLVQLQLEMEKSRSLYQQEIAEMKRNYESQLTAAELDKQKALSDLRRQMEAEKQRAVDEVKRKQWCAQCGQEAIFYCCWNTAYCDYPCQQSHWPKHMATCANSNQNTETDAAADRSLSSAELTSETPSPEKTAPRSHGGDNQ